MYLTDQLIDKVNSLYLDITNEEYHPPVTGSTVMPKSVKLVWTAHVET